MMALVAHHEVKSKQKEMTDSANDLITALGELAEDAPHLAPADSREQADLIRNGCMAKGEDPALVDQALVIDGQRRELLGKADNMRAQKKLISESIGNAIKGGDDPNGARVSQLRELATQHIRVAVERNEIIGRPASTACKHGFVINA